MIKHIFLNAVRKFYLVSIPCAPCRVGLECGEKTQYKEKSLMRSILMVREIRVTERWGNSAWTTSITLLLHLSMCSHRLVASKWRSQALLSSPINPHLLVHRCRQSRLKPTFQGHSVSTLSGHTRTQVSLKCWLARYCLHLCSNNARIYWWTLEPWWSLLI